MRTGRSFCLAFIMGSSLPVRLVARWYQIVHTVESRELGNTKLLSKGSIWGIVIFESRQYFHCAQHASASTVPHTYQGPSEIMDMNRFPTANVFFLWFQVLDGNFGYNGQFPRYLWALWLGSGSWAGQLASIGMNWKSYRDFISYKIILCKLDNL